MFGCLVGRQPLESRWQDETLNTSDIKKQGKVNFNYKSAEVRAKLPIGKKFSLSAGVMYRTHERPYGYNPVEIWLNETNESGQIVNPWYTLGFMYGYDDIYYTKSQILIRVNFFLVNSKLIY